MQDNFLNAYPALSTQAEVAVCGLWLIHGDEPLLSQWLIDAMRPHWQAHHYAIKRMELVSVKTWHEILSELDSPSLFDDATAIIVTGNHKPDKATLTALQQFGERTQHLSHSSPQQSPHSQPSNDSQQNALVWLVDKQDKRAKQSKWFTTFDNFGRVIDCNLYNEQQRQQILQHHAQQFGMYLSPEAWQLLMSHTQHHLLPAYQTLWRLSYLFAPQLAQPSQLAQTPQQPTPSPLHLGVDDLQSALVSDSQYSVFDLSDAMLAGDPNQVSKILLQLQATDEPTSLVLWVIAKDMRLIAGLMAGQDPQSLGIWRNKQGLYQNACHRHTPESIAHWSDLLYRCDQAIKGLIQQPAWELLLQSAMALSGQPLFQRT